MCPSTPLRMASGGNMKTGTRVWFIRFPEGSCVPIVSEGIIDGHEGAAYCIRVGGVVYYVAHANTFPSNRKCLQKCVTLLKRALDDFSYSLKMSGNP